MTKKIRFYGISIAVAFVFFGCSQDEACLDADLVLINTKVYNFDVGKDHWVI